MSSNDKKIIAFIGVTGVIGRTIIDALSKTNHYSFRILAGNMQMTIAERLARTYSNIELIEGNYYNEADVRKLFTSAYGAFCNTDIWRNGGFQKDIEHGKMIFDIAKELSVKHFVYNSFDYTKKLMANHGGHQCCHFDAKAIVAEYIESHDPKGPTSWAIITTSAYFENFQSFFLPTKDPNDPEQLVFNFPMADKPLILVAVDDVAWFVKFSFENPEKAKGKNFYIASDNITMNDLVKIFTEVTGVQAKYNAVPLKEFVGKMQKIQNIDFDQEKDYIGFFEQYIQGQVHRDFDALRAIHPGLLDWRKWLEKTGWKGESAYARPPPGYIEEK